MTAATVLALAACGSPAGSGGSSPAGPATAQSIVANGSDFSGLDKCPQSGSWDDYLKAEQQTDPSTYATDKAEWDQLKAAGADDGYVAAYAQNTSDCAIFSSNSLAKGRVAYAFIVRFKDESSAQANYKTSAKNFHVSDSDLADVKAAGGTVTQGSATGLGDNSLEAFVAFQGTSIFVGFWQNKRFEVAVITLNETTGDSETMSKNINGRIR